MNISRFLFLCFLLCTAALSADQPLDFRPVRLLRPLPPIVDAPTRKVQDVQQEINPSELVIGVTVNGQSRGYPINMLTGPRREIINDTLGGHKIAATW